MQTCKSGHKVAVLHGKKTDEGWNSYRLVILVQITLFCMQKRQVVSRTHSDVLFRSIRRCFASQNHRWDLGPTETCNSSPKVAVLHAQNHR